MKVACSKAIHDRAGFSLIEMLAVLAILTLLVSIAIPMLKPPPARLRLDAAARTIVAALRMSRAQAIAQNDDVEFSFDPGTNTFKTDENMTRLDRQIAVSISFGSNSRRQSAQASIWFFPDGTSSGGDISLALGAMQARVSTNWLTGAVRTDEGNE